MRHNKLSQFTIDELNRVDQDKYFDELWFLRHSYNVRRLFGMAQREWYIRTICDENDDKQGRLLAFGEMSAIADGLEVLCCEIMAHHPWWHCRLNQNRVFIPSSAHWILACKAFGAEWKPDEWGDEELYKTINGWYQL